MQNIWIDAVTAISEETYDSLDDSFASAHMGWTPMIVDRQGWNELMAILLRVVNEVIEIQSESAERLIEDDAEGISCTVATLGFPSANPKRKVGLPADAEQLAELTKRTEPKTRRGSKKKAPPKKAKAKRKSSATGKAASKPKGKNAGKAARKRKGKAAE